MLLRMGLLLRLGPNVITDETFITLGSSYYTCAFYTRGLFSEFYGKLSNKIAQNDKKAPELKMQK